MNNDTNKEKPIGYECRNALYFKAKDGSGDDLIVVNEKIHYPNNVIKRNTRFIHNFQQEVYIHKEGYRKYTQKKVWKPKSEMNVLYSTRANIEDTVKKALGIPLGRYLPMRQICRSPYVYGTDISTTSIVKKRYKDKYPNTVSDASVAVIDIETNVSTAENEILAITLTFKDKAIVATTEGFLGTTPLPKENFYKLLDKLTPEVRRDRNCDVEFFVAKTPALAVIEVFKRANQWKPDFITGWNSLAFDVPKILNTLTKEGYDPADVLSSPEIPPRYRVCQYREGPRYTVAASGRSKPLAGYEQWHWLNLSATYYFLDSMCLYFQIRKGKSLEENYKLDTILNKVLGVGKVGIPETEHLDGVDKHRVMQAKYKLEYLVYNVFDCIGVEMLDEKTKDICSTMGVLAGISDYSSYTSNPRRLADAIHFYVQEDPDFNGVLGTASDQLKTELDELVVSMKGWIVALPTERLIDNGLCLIEELPGHITKAHAYSSDIDVSSGYPNIERSMNMSKDTTYHELHRIEGIKEIDQRIVGLNILGGKVNSLTFATTIYKLPHPVEVYQMYIQKKQGTTYEQRN